MKILKSVASDKWQVTSTGLFSKSLVTRHPSLVTCRAFTMVEIAISLAVIGIALVAIIGVLPLGMNVQRDNREATVINQDATVFIEAIRNGSRGLDDLTNYVYAITNSWTNISAHTFGVNGYNYSAATIAPGFFTTVGAPINSGSNIVGVLSTPEYIDSSSGAPIQNLFNGGFSNHVVAYVRSISGPAVEKPPQDNPILQADAFGYRLIVESVPVETYAPPFWQSGAYNQGDSVSYLLNGQVSYWQAVQNTLAGDQPSLSPSWARVLYPQELANNLHELRLSFLWPTQPNGSVGNGRQTFRSLVAGQIMHMVNNGTNLYFFQSQSFTNAP